MKVSILIPTWNAGEYVGRAIKSILATGIEDMEILVMDNVSTDNTKEVVESFKDKRIVFDSKPSKTLYYALDRGIKRAKGEIISWIGADDRYDGKNLAQAISELSSSNKSWIVGGGKFVFEDGSGKIVNHDIDQDLSAAKLIGKNQLISPSIAFRKKLYDKVGGFDFKYRLAADYDLWIKAIILEKPLISKKSISLFSYNPNSFSSNSKVEMYRETISILSKKEVKKYSWPSFINRSRLRAYIVYNLVKNIFRKKSK